MTFLRDAAFEYYLFRSVWGQSPK